MNSKRKTKVFIFNMFLVAFLCFGIGCRRKNPPKPKLESLTISASTTTVFVGETLQLSIEASPSDYSLNGLIWSSSNETIATVTTTGLVYGTKEGEVNINASLDDIIGTISIMVKEQSIVDDLQFSYRITFITNSENPLPDDIYVVGDDYVPPTPSKIGYVFAGWYFDNDFQQPFDLSLITTDVTLFAKWEIKKIKIYLDEASGLDVNYLEKDYGSTLTYNDFPLPSNKVINGSLCPFLYWRDDTTELPVVESYSVVIKDQYYAFSAIYQEPLIYGKFDISEDGKTYRATQDTALQIINGSGSDFGYLSTDVTITKNDYIGLLCNFHDGDYVDAPYTSFGVEYYEFYFNTSNGTVQIRSFSGLGYATSWVVLTFADQKTSNKEYISKFNNFYQSGSTLTSIDINLRFEFSLSDIGSYFLAYIDNELVASLLTKGITPHTSEVAIKEIQRARLPLFNDNQVALKSHKAGTVFRNVEVGDIER